MAEVISLEKAFGEPAAPGAKRPAGGGEVISLAEAFGEAPAPTAGGFFQDPQARREMAGNLAGVGAQLSDMFTGVGKSLLGGMAYMLERGQSKGAGVKAAPLAAYDGRLPPKQGDIGAQRRSATEAQRVKDMFPEELNAPWRVVAENLGPEALRAYEENGVGWVMGKIGELIEGGGKKVEAAWGVPASDIVNMVDFATGALGARALKPQAQAMLKTRIGQMRSDMKTAGTPRDLTPEEMAAAYEGTKRFRPGDTTTAKPSDFEATQEMQVQPQPQVPKATKPPKAVAPKAQSLLDELDPYKVPAAVGAAVGASAWMLQNELDDEQLAAMGILGAAGMVKLKGVPEANLIEMLKQGGPGREAAAAQIYRDHVPMLSRSLQKYAKQGVEIEDVVQRTMEKGLRAIEKGSFAGDAAIGTYLYRIADNEAKMNLRYEKVRPRVESLDLEERPGAGKGDESQPSPHEQVADESVTGRSPEQVAQDRALAGAMSAALDKLPENFRRPFEMRELEGMDYAEIAESLGQPIGTVRSQINRAKEQLQKSLREYGKTAAGAGLVAGAAALADPDDYAELGLGIAALGAMKAKGGMWHPEAVKTLTEALHPGSSTRALADMPPVEAAIATQAIRMVSTYLNKHAGTETDPLKDITLPDGTRWEDATSTAFYQRKVGDSFDDVGIPNAKPGEQIWDIYSGWANVDPGVTKIGSYLAHVGDYLRANVDPAKLPQYDLVRAVRETKAWDDKLAREAEKARAKEGDVALRRMATMTTVQAWPNGMRLVKLDKPGDFAHESTVMGHSVRGYEPPKEYMRLDDVEGGVLEKAHPDWIPDSEKGMTEARFSSGHPDYGLGGWEAIKRGDAEVLSLRDAKGQSHVTIEIGPTPIPEYAVSRFYKQASPEFKEANPVPRGAEYQSDMNPLWVKFEKYVSTTPEFQDWLGNTPRQRITQIRGKGNAPVPGRYQQQIADFLNSREWGEVGDLENAGLWKGKKPDGGNVYLTDADLLAKAPSLTVDDLSWYKEQATPDTPHARVIEAILDGQPTPVEPKLIADAQAEIIQLQQTLEAADSVKAGLSNTERGSIEAMIASRQAAIYRWNGGGRPPSQQAGFITPRQAFALSATVGGATIGAMFDEEQPLLPALYGALAGGFMSTAAGRGKVKDVLKASARGADYVGGLVSTRLRKIAPELMARARDHERRVLKALDTTYDQTTPFLTALKRQSAEVQDLIARELLNGKTAALNAIPELAATYPKVRATLANIEGQLQALGRFGEGIGNYFPRIVKDFEGLKAALDQPMREGLDKVMAEAEAAMQRKRGRSLTDVEQSVVANRYLFAEGPSAHMPGYAHGRKVKEVTERLLPFYEAPAESLLRYLTGSIRDIEAARFFGKDLKTNAKGERVFNNIEESIGELTARLQREKKLTARQVMDLRSMLKSRFEGGEQSMNPALAMVRDLTNAGLLGNFTAAATQIGDSLLNIYHFGLVPTLQGVVQRVRGASVVTPKDLGLVNHIAEELSGKRLPGEVLHQTLKWSGFQAIDQFAKGTAINAALAKAKSQAGNAKGQVALTERYGHAFGDEMPALLDDLRAGRNTIRTQTLAFEALSDIQPVTKLELPQAYLDHPNGRLLYQLKSYMLKQADVVRRDAYDNIFSGDKVKFMRGVKNLAALATIYALANVPGDLVKGWLSGRDVDPFETPELIENVLSTFGMGKYNQDRLGEGKIVETATGIVMPPVRVLEDIALGREKAAAYIPLVGRPVYDRFLGGNEKREIAEKKAANKGKPPGETETLSDEAKAYLLEKRLERARKKLEAGQ